MSGQKRCACPSYVTRMECINIRYHGNEFDEQCECSCHDEDDEDMRDWYAEQLLVGSTLEERETTSDE